MKQITHLMDRITHLSGMFSGVVLVLAMMFAFVNAMSRRLLRLPIIGANEIVCYITLVAVCFALMPTEWREGNVVNTLVHENVSKKVSSFIYIITTALTIPAFIWFFILLIKQTIIYYNNNNVSIELKFPIYFVGVFCSFGFLTIALTLILKLIVRIYSFIRGTQYDFKQNVGDEAMEAIEMSKEHKK